MKHLSKFFNNLKAPRPLYLYLAGAVLCVLAIALNLLLGSASLSPTELFSDVGIRILLYVRLPRLLSCLVAGGALATAGAVVQGVLNNRLASPSILGVNAGAGFAITLCTALGFLGSWVTTLFSFFGAFFAVVLIALGAQKFSASRGTVILAGVALNALFNAFSSTIVTLNPEVGVMSNDFRVGDFSAATYSALLPAAILTVVTLLLLFILANDLDVLCLGNESARSLGMNVPRVRTLFLLLTALLAGSAVMLAGLLSFVGLIVPHTVRMLGVKRARHLLPLSALYGAAFTALCDLIARMLFSPYEIPVGIIMAFLGSPFFLALLIRQKGGHAHD